MSSLFKPMLSASLDDVDLTTLRFPLLCSPKLDGVRCILGVDGVAYSRNMKPIRNKFVQNQLRGIGCQFDGELIVGSPTEGLVLNRTQSGVMSADGEPDFKLYVFDNADDDCKTRTFFDRLESVKTFSERFPNPRIVIVEHIIINNHQELLDYEEKCLAAGYEGVMLRHLSGPYKYGRSTLKEHYLMKLKRFIEGEATVIGLEEAEENTNMALSDELGYTKRSKHQSGMVGKEMVGVILARDEKSGQILRLQPGTMNHHQRRYYWEHQNDIINGRCHWRAFGYGNKDTVRFPRYYGLREDDV